MRQRYCLALGMLAIGTWLVAEPVTTPAENLAGSPVLAQTLPPEAFEDPVAQVDPAAPIQIRVVNESDVNVDVGALVRFPPTETRIAPPAESVTFGVLHTSFLPPPIDFQVYAVLDNAMIADMTMDTEVVAENNEIIITVAVMPISDDTVEPAVRRGVRVTEAGEVYLF